MKLALGVSLAGRRRCSGGGGPAPTLSSANRTCWVPFNGDSNDDSPNLHNFGLVNGPGYIAGPGGIGQAIDFQRASNQYATIADHPDFDSAGAFSMGAWLKTNDLSVDSGFFQKIAGSSGLIIHWETSTPGWWRLVINVASSGNPGDSSSDIIADSTWQHFVFTRENSTSATKVYKNGGSPVSLPTSAAVTINTAAAELSRRYAGAAQFGMAEYFHFNRELSAAEVGVTYNGGVRLTYSEIDWT